MTREQVTLLREMGISEKDIIDRILQETSDAVSPEGQAANQPDPEPVSTPEEQPEPEAQPEPVPQPGRDDAILAAIEKLTGAIYSHNVLSSGTEDVPTKSAADIIGEKLRNN